MLEKCCIVSVGIGHWYPKGIDRMNESLNKVNWKNGRLLSRNEYPPGCPCIEEAGYAFKPYALTEALKKGMRYLLWADASVWALKPIEPIFEKIAEDGCLFFDNGFSVFHKEHSIGEWCRDASLPKFGITREESMRMPEITTSFFGLDMARRDSKIFLEDWMAYAKDGETFIVEPRDNDKGQCSSDPRVKGHRYDQTAASVIVERLGMKRILMPYYYAYYSKSGPRTICVNKGM